MPGQEEECETGASDDEDEDGDDQDDGVSVGRVGGVADGLDDAVLQDADETTSPSSSSSASSASSPAGLTVLLPNQAKSARKIQQVKRKGCSCVTVVDGTGALEFNSEDVAALLTLALRRLRPFAPLVARLEAVAASAATTAQEEAEEVKHKKEAEKNRMRALSKELDAASVVVGDDHEPGTADDHDEDEDDDDDNDDFSDGARDDAVDAQIWSAVQQYVAESRAAAAAAAVTSAAGDDSNGDVGVDSGPSTGLFSRTPLPVSRRTGNSADDGSDIGSPNASAAPAGAGAGAGGSEAEDVFTSGFTADEASDLLEYVAAARFVAQLLTEPVVEESIAQGRWAHTEQLADQVRQLAESDEKERFACSGPAPSFLHAQDRGTAAAKDAGTAAGAAAAVVRGGSLSSASDMLCLGALADVEALGVSMAQQSRFAPALEAALKEELRNALRRGQGRQRRLMSRLQPAATTAPGIISFPMIRPCCCFSPFVSGGGGFM